MSSFDVWILGFEPGEAPPAERLQAAFGMDLASAQSLERSVPKIVKHAVPAKVAGEMRQALEAIGAVVECRAARGTKPRSGGDSAAVFRAPDADLFPTGRVSAIDPFSPSVDARGPRISVDESVLQAPRPKMTAPQPEEQPRRITASLLATSEAQQRRKLIREAMATFLAGAAILAINWFFGDSVFRGEAGWIYIGFDGLGIYFIGVGVFDLIAALRD